MEVSACSLSASRKVVEEDLRSTLDSAPTSALAVLVDEMSDIGIADESGPILASAGPLDELLESSIDDESSSVRSLLNNWLIDRHAHALSECLQAGVRLLWIRARGDSEERQTFGLRLQLSERPVQVHDISSINKPGET